MSYVFFCMCFPLCMYVCTCVYVIVYVKICTFSLSRINTDDLLKTSAGQHQNTSSLGTINMSERVARASV